MGRLSTIPTLYEDVFKIKLSTLIGDRLMNEKKNYSFSYYWTRQGNEKGRINIIVNNTNQNPYIELDYFYNKIPRNYRVNLVSIPSNIGVGKVWYFLCPFTSKRCRILYCMNGYFYHRKAFTGCLYESQTHSKKARSQLKLFEQYYNDHLYEELYKKHFKKTYAGKPTKRYNSLLKKISQFDIISSSHQ